MTQVRAQIVLIRVKGRAQSHRGAARVTEGRAAASRSERQPHIPSVDSTMHIACIVNMS